MAEKDEVSHNEERWAKLKEMRDRRDGKNPPPEVKVTPSTQALDAPRDDDGKFAKPAEAAVVPAPVEPETPKEPEKAATPPPPPPSQTPKTEEIELEIDGEKTKVSVDPSLAEAFKKAETAKKEAAATVAASTAETEAAKARDAMRAEVRAEFEKRESEAKAAAEARIREAERQANQPKPPADDLFVSNPAEWRKQNDAYVKAQIEEAAERAKEESVAEIRRQQQAAAVDAEKQGRAVLREQFYRAYPQFSDSTELVDILLTKEIDSVIASGKIAKPLPPKEAEALRAVTFANVAQVATGKLAKLMGAARKVVVPPPPSTVQSAPIKPAAPPKEEAPKAREKFPKSSVSAMLRDHQKSKEKKSA